MNVKEDDFLAEIYRESGNQIRNLNASRNTFLSFYIVGLAAFVGLIGRGDAAPSKSVWWIFVAFSVVGALGVWITHEYIQRALQRQRLINERLLSKETFKYLKLIPVSEWPRPLSKHFFKWAHARRLDLFPLGIYVVSAFLGTLFAICGDWFGLTK